jgi:DNA-binding MarR family transcriptional regulator
MDFEDNQELVYQILLTANWLDGNLRDLLKQYGITVQQYHVLKLIQDSTDTINHTKIKKAVIEKDADISRLINRLAQLNYINKSSVAGDKRQNKLRLSSKGVELMNLLQGIPQKTQNLFDNLEQNEAEQLINLLEKCHS